MKARFFLLCVGAIFLFALNAQATPVFSDDFEGDLSAWTGKTGDVHHGQIVDDPLDSSNDVLKFTELNAGGDIFTKSVAGAAFPGGTYWLAFDYLGQGATTDSGGYVGVSQGFAGTHKWLWATGIVSGASDVLIDDSQWNSYLFEFTYLSPFHLMFEEFSGSDSTVGNAYFDNITLHNSNPVPEPATMLLLGTGLIGLAGFRRKKFKKK